MSRGNVMKNVERDVVKNVERNIIALFYAEIYREGML
jgi:hypothetical protein